MVDITHKNNTLRKAIASAVLKVSNIETIRIIENKQVPKGDVFEFSRAAGLLAIKKTSDVIPDCHPLPVEFARISHEIKGLEILITVEVHTIYKTGVEVEAMHGAAITALTMYDMLKPVDKGVIIGTIKLEEKKGGKSDFQKKKIQGLTAATIVCSDSVAVGTSEDRSGKLIAERLKAADIQVLEQSVVADEVTAIQEKVNELIDKNISLVILSGGTGLSTRDVTPEAVAPLIETPIPGIMEAARNFGQQRTPYAMLSRGVAGFTKNTLLITLPGSPNGVKESLDALFPAILHTFQIRGGARH